MYQIPDSTNYRKNITSPYLWIIITIFFCVLFKVVILFLNKIKFSTRLKKK